VDRGICRPPRASQSAPHGIFDGLIGLAAHVHLAMVWNGKRVTDVAEVLPEEVPSLCDLYVAATVDGGPWAAEERLIAQHGLAYVLVEGTPTSDGMAWEQLVLETVCCSVLRSTNRGWRVSAVFTRPIRIVYAPSSTTSIHGRGLSSGRLGPEIGIHRLVAGKRAGTSPGKGPFAEMIRERSPNLYRFTEVRSLPVSCRSC
jgi:hypothetical protein